MRLLCRAEDLQYFYWLRRHQSGEYPAADVRAGPLGASTSGAGSARHDLIQDEVVDLLRDRT